jgi:hypothetical protein
MLDDIYSKVLDAIIKEMSTMAGGAVGGVATPLGSGPKAGSKGERIYKKSTATDKKHRSKGKKKKTKAKSVQWYLKNGSSKTKLNEQNSTRCLTSGAQFYTSINNRDVGINVNLPFDLEIDEAEASNLETLLHNSVEMILRPYFMNTSNNISTDLKKEKGRKVIAFDFHDTLVDEQDDGTVIPRTEMIEKLKGYYDNYSFIVIYTAAPESDRNLVTGQLHSLGIPYDVLAMEKPRFDKMYDDRYVGPNSDWV